MSDQTDQTLKKPRRNRWGTTAADAPQDSNQSSTTTSSTMNDGPTENTTTTTNNPPTQRSTRSRWGANPDVIKTEPDSQPIKVEMIPPSTTTTTTTPTSLPTLSTTTQSLLLSSSNLPTFDQYASFPLSSTIHALLALPGGNQFVTRFKQHLWPMTNEYLDSVLPKNFITIPPPKGYIPPTKDEIKNAIVDFNAFAMKYQPQIKQQMDDSSTATSVTMGETQLEQQQFDATKSIGVLFENIPHEIAHLKLSRNDLFVFNDLFSGKMTNPAARSAVIGLILIKNGPAKEKKAEIRRITRDHGRTLLLEYYLTPLLAYLEHGIQQQDLDAFERHVLFSFLARLLPIYRTEFTPYVGRLVLITRSLLVHNDYLVRNEGGAFLQMLTRVVGLNPILKVVLPDVNSPDDPVRDAVARTFSYVTSIVGLKQTLPFLEALLKSNTAPYYAVDTGLRTIQKIAMLTRSALVPDMEKIILLILPTFFKNNGHIITAALQAISRVCEACAPYVCPSIDEVVQVILTLAPKCKGRSLNFLVQAVTSFLPSLQQEHAIRYWSQLQDTVIGCCQLGDSQSLTIGIRALSIAIQAEAISAADVRDHILPFLANSLFEPKTCSDKNNVNAIQFLCTKIASRIGLQLVYEVLIPLLQHENQFLSTAAAQILAALATKIGLQTLPYDQEKLLVDHIIKLITHDIGLGAPSPSRFNSEMELFGITTAQHTPTYILNTIDKTGSFTRYPILQSLSLILVALGPQRCEKHLLKLLTLSKWILSHKHEVFRYHGSVIITRAIAQISTPNEDNRKILRETWSLLYEHLGEEKPLVLSGILCALRATLQTMKQLNFWMRDDGDNNNANTNTNEGYSKTLYGNTTSIDLTPSPTDVLTRLTSMLHNRHECVILTVTRLLSLLGSCWGYQTPSQEWVRIITQFATTLLTSGHRCIRKSVVTLIGISAQSVGSVDIILKLLPHLQHPNRTVRIGITSAIGCVAEICGIAMVLPLLLHQYEIADIKTCTAILKSIVVCVQQCIDDIPILPTALYPLLTHVFTSKHSKITRIGIHISSTLLVNCITHGHTEIGKNFAEAIGAHLAPFRAVLKNVNSWWWEWRRIALSLSYGLSGNYVRALYTGLFHCARRVRENHWLWYNQLLLLKQSTMPMHYAKLTTSDKLTNNNPLNRDGLGNDDNNTIILQEDEITFDEIAKNQYYDPYICQSLYVPF